MAKKISTKWKKGSRGGGNSQWLKFKGVASYAQVYRPDEFRGASNWKINLHPDTETIQAIKDAGIQLTLKDKAAENADGKFFTFKRPTERDFRDGTTYFAPPKIVDKDGNNLVYYTNEAGDEISSQRGSDEFIRHGDPVLIGNGSLVELTVEVYQTGSFGKGNRFAEVKILDLVEYEEADPDEGDIDEEEEEEEKPAKKSRPSGGSGGSVKKRVDW